MSRELTFLKLAKYFGEPQPVEYRRRKLKELMKIWGVPATHKNYIRIRRALFECGAVPPLEYKTLNQQYEEQVEESPSSLSDNPPITAVVIPFPKRT